MTRVVVSSRSKAHLYDAWKGGATPADTNSFGALEEDSGGFLPEAFQSLRDGWFLQVLARDFPVETGSNLNLKKVLV